MFKCYDNKKIKNDFEDERGAIRDILVKEKIDFVTIIFNKKNAVRGKSLSQRKQSSTFMFWRGQSLLLQNLRAKKLKKVLSEGDLLLNEPLEWHAIKSIEDSKLLILTRGLRGGDDYEADTFKIDTPILT